MIRTWLKSGRIVMDAGRAVLCDDCPCDDTWYCVSPPVDTGTGTGTQTLIETPCCPAGIPSVLNVTVTDKTGDCTCLPDSFTLTYDEGSGLWNNSFASNGDCQDGDTTQFNLSCSGSDCNGWDLANFSLDSITLDSCSCEPLQLVYLVEHGSLASWCNGAGTATLTITE